MAEALATAMDRVPLDVMVAELKSLRSSMARESSKVAAYGRSMLKIRSLEGKLGKEVWEVYEQLCIACLDINDLKLAGTFLQRLEKRFPDSIRVGRLGGMVHEASGKYKEASKLYESLLEKDPLNQSVLRRRCVLARIDGGPEEGVKKLREYLDIFKADIDAWQLLAHQYLELRMFREAIFCFEELILARPQSPHYHIKYAETLYSVGDDIRLALKHFLAGIELSSGESMRAMYGVAACLAALKASAKSGKSFLDSDKHLEDVTVQAIMAKYRKFSSPELKSIAEQGLDLLLQS